MQKSEKLLQEQLKVMEDTQTRFGSVIMDLKKCFIFLFWEEGVIFLYFVLFVFECLGYIRKINSSFIQFFLKRLNTYSSSFDSK